MHKCTHTLTHTHTFARTHTHTHTHTHTQVEMEDGSVLTSDVVLVTVPLGVLKRGSIGIDILCASIVSMPISCRCRYHTGIDILRTSMPVSCAYREHPCTRMMCVKTHKSRAHRSLVHPQVPSCVSFLVHLASLVHLVCRFFCILYVVTSPVCV